MILLLIFSFLAGIVTILSPCILPVLPIVLSGSLSGGKQRPLGIVTGFIISFTFFTLFLALIVQVLGISATIIRYISIGIIFFFGLSLLLPAFQTVMETMFSRLSSAAAGTVKREGFFGGVILGLSLGLVWTPCVGPILASVIALALTGSVSGTAAIITLSYALGTALPMLAITYGGRVLLARIPGLLAHTGTIQKAFGVVMILTALAMVVNADRTFQTYILKTFPSYGSGLTSLEDTAVVRDQLNQLYAPPGPTIVPGKPMNDVVQSKLDQAPELLVGGEWLNSPPLMLSQLHGKVVLIDFWTYTCINCIRTLPYVKSWYEKYHDKGLVIIGVHTPEFEFEKNTANVAQAIKDFALPYPVMQDNNYRTWSAYHNRYWPAEYLIGKDGRIRSTHFGEGDYDQSERHIQELLSEDGPKITDAIHNPTYQVETQTPETYLGYERLEYFSSPEQVKQDASAVYTLPSSIESNTIAYGGSWTVGSQYAVPAVGSSLRSHFDAQHVYLVMRPNATVSGNIRVLLDGKPIDASVAGSDVHDGIVSVTADRLYTLVNLPSMSDHILTLEFLDSNLQLYAFTFG